ncbi:MAG TPA: (2Fe-2S)-binding protein [Lachnoclostridium phytofermentans]|uniref:(2Fe-2S)-binding protein n=1 Tax=Lachnoclostridium phytofermentans TaxID=66219 RepID=A0A3D2X437_9FIRM|nr:(2Fe-2S)-binding protein [Lachnoclostridium sp.]HCL01872.1 (2Fe-2S)-binding protein [Lachnoclostridium phytofermentans]
MNDDDIICTCFDVSVKDIKDAYANGATTIEAIGEATQAGTLCGACIDDIESLLESLSK